MTTRSDVSFVVNGNIELAAWLFLPTNGSLPRPAITMAHGYAGVREHGIAKFANAFADAGFVVLLHDHRTFGASHGEPRQDVDPWGRSLIGVAPYPIWKADQKWTRGGSDYGARVMPAATRWFLAPPIAG
jgi:fermentation-respiration switch protein FrsA (DUF1100 family)